MKPARLNHGSGAGAGMRNSRGFTLMEMIVVLAIIVLMTGFFAMSFDESPDERLLSPVAQDLKKLSRQAVTEAAAYREDYAILMSSGQLQLVRGQGAGAGGAVSLEIEETLTIPTGATVSAKWPGDDDWQAVDGQAWLFRSGGLCEPLIVRFGSTRGNAFIELAFDPLTGMAEEQSYFP